MNADTRQPNRPRRTLKVAEVLGIVLVPVAVAGTCLVIDLLAGNRTTQGLPRAALLHLFAGVLALVVMIAVLPWWSASRFADWKGIGAVVTGFEIAVALSAVLMAGVGLLHKQPCLREILHVHAIVMGVGLLLMGLTGILRCLFRSGSAAAFAVMLVGFAALSAPFWGNPIIRSASTERRAQVIDCVITATPVSACSSAVGYSLFRGYALYDLSLVADYHPLHRLPAWWLYALIVGGAGAVLAALSGWVGSRQP